MNRTRFACLGLAAAFLCALVAAGCAPKDTMEPNIKPEEKALRKEKSGDE